MTPDQRPADPDHGSAAPQSLPTAAAWSIGAKFVDQLIGVASISILARLLSPSDFGLVAMAAALVAIVEVFTSFSFDWALVRVQSPTREHFDTAWTLKLCLAIATCVVLGILAIPLSDAIGKPQVAPLIVAMGVNTLIGGFENIGVVNFRRDMRFDREFRFRLAGRLAGFMVAVGTAATTGSYWALVLGMTASQIAGIVASYSMHSFRPRWDTTRRKELLSFSVWMMAGHVIETARQKFAALWLGRTLGSSAVGTYSMASQLSQLAASEIAAPINRTVFTRYSLAAGDVTALRQGFLRVSGLIWAIGLPAAIGIGVCAPQIVAVLLGDQWADSVAVLQILACAGVIGVMAANTHYVHWALGRSRFVTLLSGLALATFVVLALGLGPTYGLVGVAVAQVAASLLALCRQLSRVDQGDRIASDRDDRTHIPDSDCRRRHGLVRCLARPATLSRVECWPSCPAVPVRPFRRGRLWPVTRAHLAGFGATARPGTGGRGTDITWRVQAPGLAPDETGLVNTIANEAAETGIPAHQDILGPVRWHKCRQSRPTMLRFKSQQSMRPAGIPTPAGPSEAPDADPVAIPCRALPAYGRSPASGL